MIFFSDWNDIYSSDSECSFLVTSTPSPPTMDSPVMTATKIYETAKNFAANELAKFDDESRLNGEAMIADASSAEKLSDEQWGRAMDYALRKIYLIMGSEDLTIFRSADILFGKYHDTLIALASTTRARPVSACRNCFINAMASRSLPFFKEIARNAPADVTMYLLRCMAQQKPSIAAGFYAKPIEYLHASPEVATNVTFVQEIEEIMEKANQKMVVKAEEDMSTRVMVSA